MGWGGANRWCWHERICRRTLSQVVVTWTQVVLPELTCFVFPPAAYLNTGIILMNQCRLDESKRTFLTCADIPDENLKDPHAHKSSVTSCLYNLGKLLHEQGHQEVKTPLVLASHNSTIYNFIKSISLPWWNAYNRLTVAKCLVEPIPMVNSGFASLNGVPHALFFIST